MSQTELTFEPRNVLRDALDRAFEDVPIGSTLTAESLRDKLSWPAREQLQIPTRKNLLGQYFMRLARSGRVTPDGWQEAERDAARHRALRRWKRIA